MSGQYAWDWKPKNLGGTIYYDPREELNYWADSAQGPMVAVPVETLRAAAELRVCRESTVMTADEDGPLSQPLTIHCIKRREHLDDHYNGYTHWQRIVSEVSS